MPSSTVHPQRSRRDRCPGVFRPWPAEDGGLVRLRLIGGRLTGTSLAALGEVAATYGDGDVHLTRRANLQLRAMPTTDDVLPDEVVEAIAATGLLPSRTHELVRNVMVSPQTGLAGGRTDLRPVATELDRLLCADPELARLPGRFLFVLDDGRGDLVDRTCDLGLVVLDETSAQLRVGAAGVPSSLSTRRRPSCSSWPAGSSSYAATGPTRPGTSTSSAEPLVPARRGGPAGADSPARRCPSGPSRAAPMSPYPTASSTPPRLQRLAPHAELVVTPWHGVLVPDGEEDQ